MENVIGVISNRGSFDYAEYKTADKWVDGKPIYRKVVNFGALPNATTKNLAHGIANMDKYWLDTTNSFVTDSGSSARYLPSFASPQAIGSSWTAYVTAVNITVITGSDRSGFTGTFTIRYTKTTD